MESVPSNKNALKRNFTNLAFIGKGTFGLVAKATLRDEPDKVCAIKFINIKSEYDDEAAREVINIRDKLQNRHANLVEYQDCWLDVISNVKDKAMQMALQGHQQDRSEKIMCIRMEYCESNLKDHLFQLNKQQFVDKCVPDFRSDQLVYFKQICSAIVYMHSLNMAHRDLKPENILLKVTPDGQKVVKVADFGFSKVIDISGAHTRCGTILYSAPEVWKEMYYGLTVDIYSLGIILFEMLFHFYGTKDDHKKHVALFIKERNFPPVSHRLKGELTSLMLRMTDPDRSKRPPAERVLHAVSAM